VAELQHLSGNHLCNVSLINAASSTGPIHQLTRCTFLLNNPIYPLYLMSRSHNHALDLYYSGSTGKKLSTLNALFCEYGKHLLENREIHHSLRLLKNHAENLSAHMLDMKLDRLCTHCATTSDGGCCSSYMEANSNALLLLINQLYGVDVKKQHTSEVECCFLGDTGCILTIKPIFCLNYNCKHIVDQAGKQEMATLEYLSGRMLNEQINLESIIISIINF